MANPDEFWPDQDPGAAPGPGPTPPPTPAPPPAAPAAPTKRKVPPIGDIVGNDPYFKQLEALLKAMGADDAALAQYKMNRMKQYYGSANDPLSILGRIFQGYEDKKRYITNTLAGRDMIFSGETGWQQGRAALDYQRANYDANWRLQDYIDGIKEGLAQQERNRQLQLLQGQYDAVARWLQDNPALPDPAGAPPPGGMVW